MERIQKKPLLVPAAMMAAAMIAAGSADAGVTPEPGYQISHQINNTFLAGIDLVHDTQLVGGAYGATLDLHKVALNAGPVGPSFYTQPALPSGMTFGGGFIATDGVHVLSGQTGFPPDALGLYPGRVFLTALADGASTALDVPGNFDAASVAGQFYLSASAGTATGLSDDGSSGIYRVERTGGTASGLNLILDIGSPSGVVSGDAAGNLAFSLGGTSPALGGGLNDIYRLPASAVDAGAAAGPTAGTAPGAAQRLITGSALAAAVAPGFAPHVPPDGFVFSGISDLLFNTDGDLIVGLSGFLFDSDFSFVGVIGAGLLLNVSEAGGDYQASVVQLLYTNDAGGGGSLAYRASDDTLWISADGNLYGLAVIPEPATLALMSLAVTAVGLRRRSRREGRS